MDPGRFWFLLSRVIRKDRDEPFVYNSGVPLLLRAQSGAALLVITLGVRFWQKRVLLFGRLYHQKSVTVSRGGYGRSSSARGHWGGYHAETQRSCATGSGPDRR